MAMVERVIDGKDTILPLRITRRKPRKVSKRRTLAPVVRVRCGCCKESVSIHTEADPIGDIHQDTLEINGVLGTIDQWRKVLLPLLGVNPESKK